MRTNLATMIEQSQQAGAEVLLSGIDIPPNYGQAYRDAFTSVFHSLADEYDIPLVPFLLEDITLNKQLMQSDGIHPTAEAQPIILDNVWPELEPMLEETYQASSQWYTLRTALTRWATPFFHALHACSLRTTISLCSLLNKPTLTDGGDVSSAIRTPKH